MNTMMLMTVVSAAVTLMLSLGLPLIMRPLLERLGIIDVPTERSSHERPVLRGLGLGVLVAMMVGGIIGVVWLSFDSTPAAESRPASWVTLTCVLAIAAASGILGFAEDLAGVSVNMRSVLLLTIALATGLLLMMGADVPAWLDILLVIYAVLFVSGYINVANFMDGLNGISGFHGAIAGIFFAVAGFVTELDWLIIAGGILATAFIGFLPWNLSRKGGFLGDVGSYLLGGATAATSLFALVSGVPLLATIGPMVIYFGDVAVTLVKRVLEKKKWDEPHKEHAYQRLQQAGLSHVAASGVAALATLATSVLGVLSLFLSPAWWPLLFAGGLVTLVLYLLMPRFLTRKRALSNA